MRLSTLELFAGIGGITLGLEMASPSFQPAAFCEINPYSKAVLHKHWPQVKQYDDVRQLTRNALYRDGVAGIDLIAGGFPCQPFSHAGKRQGENDPRHLWPEFARLIGEIRPRWIGAENVRGLLSMAGGGTFGAVLADLASLGYDAEWHLFPASAIGAHHERERVWIVAYPNGSAGQTSGPDNRFGEAATTCCRCPAVAYTDGKRQLQPQGGECHERERSGDCGKVSRPLADAVCTGCREQHAPAQPGCAGHSARRGDTLDWAGGQWAQPFPLATSPRKGWWNPEPGFRDLADGIPGRLDALEALGNAVVPEAAQVIGYAIHDAEGELARTGRLPERIVRDEHVLRVANLPASYSGVNI